jgi:hypothetical protein
MQSDITCSYIQGDANALSPMLARLRLKKCTRVPSLLSGRSIVVIGVVIGVAFTSSVTIS